MVAMMRGGFLLLALLSVGFAREQAKVTPVEKVIELLKKLEVQTTEEGKKEAAEYDKYACFCKEQADEKQYAIEKSQKKIEELAAKIKALDADISALDGEIGELGKKITGLKTKISNAEIKREGEHDTYVEKEADASSAIDAVKRAIEALKESKGDLEGHVDQEVEFAQVRKAAVLAQATITRSSLNQAQWAVVNKLAQPNSGESYQYEYHSNDIIATLETLLSKFQSIKEALDQEEFETNSAFEKERLGDQNLKKFAEKEKAEKESIREEKEESKNKAEEDKTQESEEKTADSEFLTVLTQECEKKAGAFDQRSKSRAAELTAISEAMKALEEGVAPNYAANKKLVGLQKKAKVTHKGHWVYVEDAPQGSKAASFLQLRRGAGRVSDADRSKKVMSFLAEAAEKIHSPLLSAMALKVQTAEDHFVKVRGLIKDLLKRLEDQAAAEATQKSFCDTKMSAAVALRDGEQAKIEDYSAQITEKEAEVQTLKEEIADLSAQISADQKALNEATILREEEKAENEKTIEDAGAGKDAVQNALNILKQYYQPSLVQYTPPNSDRSGNTVADLAPEFDDSEYSGNQDASKGIIGMLEVILSDFDRTVTTVTQEESDADGDFIKQKGELEGNIDTNEKAVKNKNGLITQAEDDITTLTDNKKGAEEQHKSALDELEKLHSMCVAGEETYAERVAKRNKEIKALKEAHDILENWQG